MKKNDIVKQKKLKQIAGRVAKLGFDKVIIVCDSTFGDGYVVTKVDDSIENPAEYNDSTRQLFNLIGTSSENIKRATSTLVNKYVRKKSSKPKNSIESYLKSIEGILNGDLNKRNKKLENAIKKAENKLSPADKIKLEHIRTKKVLAVEHGKYEKGAKLRTDELNFLNIKI